MAQDSRSFAAAILFVCLAGVGVPGLGNLALAQPASLPPPTKVKSEGIEPGPAPVSRPVSEIAPAAPDADIQVVPIDLPTALRLANASNPTIAVAREMVQEAYARLQQARVDWLPNLEGGPAYVRHDGRIQNSTGFVFPTSKSNLFIGSGASLTLETSDAVFGCLVARRLTAAQAAAARAVTHNIQLDVALTYLDLLQAYAALAINADTLGRAQLLRNVAEAAERNGLSRTTADVTRARTEVDLRTEERINLEEQASVVAARLAQLLLLQPTVELRPIDPAVAPIAVVPATAPLDDLVATAWLNRPELEESRALVAAALARWRQARTAPLFPRLQASYYGGEFGGGINDNFDNFGSRGDGTAQVIWHVQNFGLGDLFRAHERRAQYIEANFHVQEVQARVAAEVTAAAKTVRRRGEALASAQEAVQQALESWRRLRIAAFGVNSREKLLNTVEPLIAVQALAQARTQYLQQVIEYNKAQFRLYTALGQPPESGLPQATAHPVQVPVAPPEYVPAPLPKFGPK
jgi:outer membrane protein TolC